MNFRGKEVVPVVNAPNAQICGGIPGHNQWRDRMRAIFGENTHGGTYTIIRGYGNNRRRVCGPIEQHKKQVFEYLLNAYQHSQYFKLSHYVLWDTRDTVESGPDNTSKLC